MEFQYTVDPYATKPIMLLNDDIGYDPKTGRGIDGAKFMAELMALDAMRPQSIEVWVNSPGGGVLDGYNIYGAMLRTQTKVDTVGVGCMASIAAVIFQAGRTRTMMDYSWLMYHNPYGGDDKSALEVMKDSIAKMVSRSGKPESEILAMMKKTTYITAAEALEYGMCDKVEDSADHNKKRLSSFTDTNAFHLEAKKIVNKLIDNKTPSKMSFKLVTNKLGLSADANEDSILAAINDIENKGSIKTRSLEDKIKDLEEKMKNDGDEMDKLKKELADSNAAKDALDKAKTKAESDLSTLKKEKEDAEDLALTEKCKNKAKEFAHVGRIKDEEKVIDYWTALLKADYDLTVEQIEALPMTKKAPVINQINTGDKPKYSMGIAMAEIKAKYDSQNKVN